MGVQGRAQERTEAQRGDQKSIEECRRAQESTRKSRRGAQECVGEGKKVQQVQKSPGERKVEYESKRGVQVSTGVRR